MVFYKYMRSYTDNSALLHRSLFIDVAHSHIDMVWLAPYQPYTSLPSSPGKAFVSIYFFEEQIPIPRLLPYPSPTVESKNQRQSSHLSIFPFLGYNIPSKGGTPCGEEH